MAPQRRLNVFPMSLATIAEAGRNCCRWCCSVVVGCVVAAAVVHAADPVPAQSAPRDTALSQAAEQLQDLKTDSTAHAPSAGSRLPRLDLPTPNAGSEPQLLPRAEKRLRPADRQKNWLVDGVLGPEANRFEQGRRNRGLGSDDPRRGKRDAVQQDSARSEMTDVDPESEQDGLADDRVTAATGHAERTEMTAPAEKPQPFGALAPYLSDWLTPGDLLLLQGSLSTPPPEARALLSDPSAVDAVAQTGPMSPGVGGSARDADRIVAASAPAQNPFLEFLSPPPTLPPVQPPAPSWSPPPAIPVPETPAVEPAPAKSTIPDFVKPARDEKYFKPLKRF